jgi:hypothetical protein
MYPNIEIVAPASTSVRPALPSTRDAASASGADAYAVIDGPRSPCATPWISR